MIIGCQAASIIGRIEKDAVNNWTCCGYRYGGEADEREDALSTGSGPSQSRGRAHKLPLDEESPQVRWEGQ
jgi:hypothetical protein